MFGSPVSIQRLRTVKAVAICALWPSTGIPQSISDYDDLVNRNAEIHMQYSTDSQREVPLSELLGDAERHLDENKGRADAWIAVARVRFGYANTQGPVTGMRLLRQVKDELETAIDLDSNSQNGFAQAFLGYLYAGLPPWPLSFGNAKTAQSYLNEAMQIDSDSIENNYFKAAVLVNDKDYKNAQHHIERAENKLATVDELSPALMYYRNSLAQLKGRLLGL